MSRWTRTRSRPGKRRDALAPVIGIVALVASDSVGSGLVFQRDDAAGVVVYARPSIVVYRSKPTSPRIGSPSETTPEPYDALIRRAARAHGVDPDLVKAIIVAESRFNPRAISHRGAQGLMQLMPATARSLGVRDPFRPESNVFGGVRYLRRMIDRYQDVTHALAAYNAGPSAVDRHGGVPPYPETQAYLRRVMANHERFRASSETKRLRHGAGPHEVSEFRLSRYAGQVLLVHFWATWCRPCRREFPRLVSFYAGSFQELEEQGLRLVAVSTDPRIEDLQDFLERHEVPFPMFFDPFGELKRHLGVIGIPSTVVIGRDGRVAGQVIGEQDWGSDALLRRLESYLSDGEE